MADFVKDPDEKLDYKIDWSTWLGADTIVSSDFTVTGATKFSDSFDDTSSTVVLTGGTAGTIAKAKCQITTAAGWIAEKTLIFAIKEK